MNTSVISRHDQLQAMARLMKVIAHPVKLEILQLLGANGAMDVSTLCAHIGAGCEISMMSHHLAKMRDNGVLLSEKKGKQVFYNLVDKRILKVFDCFEQINS